MVISIGRAASIASLVIVALMIAGTIEVTVDDAWLWGLLSLYGINVVANKGRGRRPWEQRWWWDRPAARDTD